MKFLHTADWQLGMKAAHVGQAASRVREERLAAARRIGEVARDNCVDFVLVAGDTFENNGVERVLVQKAVDIMSGYGMPVYIIPGNHDPLVPGSVWEHPAWKHAENVHILHEQKPLDIPGGILYPCPVRDKQSRTDPTLWIPSEKTETIRIGIAHGTVEGIPQQEPDHPIPRNAALRSGLDYLALGHWHSTAYYMMSDGAVRMAYSGTHESTSFGERDSGNVLIVDIKTLGAVPTVTRVQTGQLKWNAIEKTMLNPGDLSKTRQEIESAEYPESTLISLQLTGLLATEESKEIARIREILESRFLFGKIDISALRPSPQDTRWLESLPPGILQKVALRLQQLADPHYTGKRPESATPEVASRALIELYALISEVTP